MLREGVASLLTSSGIEVVAQFGHAEGLLHEVVARSPDVAILDVRMPPTNTNEGLEVAVDIRRHSPQTGLLIFSQRIETKGLTQLLELTGDGVGYLLKERLAESDQLVSAVRRIARGEQVIDPLVIDHLMGRAAERGLIGELTAREFEVLALIAEGFSNDAIAEYLVITRGAVEKHASSIFSKLELDTAANRRVQAVLRYLDHKLLM